MSEILITTAVVLGFTLVLVGGAWLGAGSSGAVAAGRALLPTPA